MIQYSLYNTRPVMLIVFNLYIFYDEGYARHIFESSMAHCTKFLFFFHNLSVQKTILNPLKLPPKFPLFIWTILETYIEWFLSEYWPIVPKHQIVKTFWRFLWLLFFILKNFVEVKLFLFGLLWKRRFNYLVIILQVISPWTGSRGLLLLVLVDRH